MTEWIEKSSYFELLEMFEAEKSTTGATMGNRRFIEARKELIKRYKKHSEAYKFWLGQVYKKRQQILEAALLAALPSNKAFASCVKDKVYAIYSTNVSKKHAAPIDTRTFIDHLIGTEGNRTKITIFPQQKISRSRSVNRKTTPLSQYLTQYSRYESRLSECFAYHVHPVDNVRKAKKRAMKTRRMTLDNSRVTLRLVPDKAADVFRGIAQEIVGSTSDKWAAIQSAKIMGPEKLPKSPDSLIIYVKSRDRQVIKNIVDFLAKIPGDPFLPGGPMGMFELGKGITYADSSDPNRGRSFGSTRGEAIHENLTSIFIEALKDPKKSAFEVLRTMTEDMLHLGVYKAMPGVSSLDYTMPAFRRPFSNMAVDPFAHHRRK